MIRALLIAAAVCLTPAAVGLVDAWAWTLLGVQVTPIPWEGMRANVAIGLAMLGLSLAALAALMRLDAREERARTALIDSVDRRRW